MKKIKCKIKIKATSTNDGWLDCKIATSGDENLQYNSITCMLCEMAIDNEISLKDLKSDITECYKSMTEERKED